MRDEFLDLRYDTVAAGHADGAALDAGEGIETRHSLIDAIRAFGFAGIDDNEGAAGEEKCRCGVQTYAARTYDDGLG